MGRNTQDLFPVQSYITMVYIMQKGESESVSLSLKL